MITLACPTQNILVFEAIIREQSSEDRGQEFVANNVMFISVSSHGSLLNDHAGMSGIQFKN